MIWVWPWDLVKWSECDHEILWNDLSVTLRCSVVIWVWPCEVPMWSERDLELVWGELNITLGCSEMIWVWPWEDLMWSEYDLEMFWGDLSVTLRCSQMVWVWLGDVLRWSECDLEMFGDCPSKLLLIYSNHVYIGAWIGVHILCLVVRIYLLSSWKWTLFQIKRTVSVLLCSCFDFDHIEYNTAIQPKLKWTSTCNSWLNRGIIKKCSLTYHWYQDHLMI